jgi:hypothetical protein
MYRWIALLVLMACGGPGANTGGVGGGSGAGGSGGSGGGSSGNGGTCCLNGSFYDCQTKSGFDMCAGFDVGGCHAACSGPDFNCHTQCDSKAASATHDPSACTRVASRDGECGSSGTCLGSKGAKCTYSSQCSTNNCTDGYCYANSNGNRCTYSSQCDSNNCTDGCCSGNAKGNKCTYSSQCNSNNCTDGKCQ